MKIKGIIDEDFVNYKYPCMYICTAYCDFKCDRENGTSICQNEKMFQQKTIDLDTDKIIQRFLNNPITNSIVFSGLEPFNQFEELFDFIMKLRLSYHCNDTIIIYTGFYKEEIEDQIQKLRQFPNIIVKFGRFIPNQKSHYDILLGINLASDNQYAEYIS